MRLQKKALLLILVAGLIVAGIGSFMTQAAKESDIATVDVQAIFTSYIEPLVNDSLQPELKKLQTEFDAKAKGLSDDERTKLFQQYQARLDSMRQDMINTNLSKLEGIIQEVAQASGYSIVLDKSTVVYGGTEITAQVVTKWKAKK